MPLIARESGDLSRDWRLRVMCLHEEFSCVRLIYLLLERGEISEGWENVGKKKHFARTTHVRDEILDWLDILVLSRAKQKKQLRKMAVKCPVINWYKRGAFKEQLKPHADRTEIDFFVCCTICFCVLTMLVELPIPLLRLFPSPGINIDHDKPRKGMQWIARPRSNGKMPGGKRKISNIRARKSLKCKRN